jgi:hypothetical protein
MSTMVLILYLLALDEAPLHMNSVESTLCLPELDEIPTTKIAHLVVEVSVWMRINTWTPCDTKTTSMAVPPCH